MRTPQPSLFDIDIDQAPPCFVLAVPTVEEAVSQPPAAVRKDDKLTQVFIDTVVWALTAPITVTESMPQDERDFLIPMHRDAIIMERMVSLMRFWRAAEGREASQVIRDAKDLMGRLTNREVCLVMSALSALAPLPDYLMAEYMRAFAASFGVDQFLMIQGEWFEAINPVHCQELREFEAKARNTFPILDKKWIEQFNKTARAAHEAKRQAAKEQAA